MVDTGLCVSFKSSDLSESVFSSARCGYQASQCGRTVDYQVPHVLGVEASISSPSS